MVNNQVSNHCENHTSVTPKSFSLPINLINVIIISSLLDNQDQNVLTLQITGFIANPFGMLDLRESSSVRALMMDMCR